MSIRSSVEIGRTTPPPFIPAKGSGATMTLQFAGKAYDVTFVRQEADGRQTPLPANFDQEALNKAKELTKQLFEAHELHNKTLTTPPDEPTEINTRGLIYKNRTTISHDFALDPLNKELSHRLITQLYTAGITPPAILKAQDVWNGIETLVQDKWVSTPATPPPLPVPSAPPPPLPPAPMAPTPDLSMRTTPKTSTGLALEGHRFDQPDWFEKIPSPRVKQRILSNMSRFNLPTGSPEARRWQELSAKGDPMPIIARELELLNIATTTSSSTIDPAIRQLAEQILSTQNSPAFVPSAVTQRNERVQALITGFIAQEFTHKEQLFALILKQAQAENRAHSDATIDWAKQNYLNNREVFTQALAHWLDTL